MSNKNNKSKKDIFIITIPRTAECFNDVYEILNNEKDIAYSTAYVPDHIGENDLYYIVLYFGSNKDTRIPNINTLFPGAIIEPIDKNKIYEPTLQILVDFMISLYF